LKGGFGESMSSSSESTYHGTDAPVQVELNALEMVSLDHEALQAFKTIAPSSSEIVTKVPSLKSIQISSGPRRFGPEGLVENDLIE